MAVNWQLVARMDERCPVVFVQVADFFVFKPLRVMLIVEC